MANGFSFGILILRADTTDVQRVEAIFYENRLYLRCWFAIDSLANGCLIKLLLRDSNETEDYEINREEGYTCNRANNQLEAYSDLVVLDIEANGLEGNISLPVLPKKLNTLEEYMQATGCKGGIHSHTFTESK